MEGSGGGRVGEGQGTYGVRKYAPRKKLSFEDVPDAPVARVYNIKECEALLHMSYDEVRRAAIRDQEGVHDANKGKPGKHTMKLLMTGEWVQRQRAKQRLR